MDIEIPLLNLCDLQGAANQRQQPVNDEISRQCYFLSN